MKNKVFILSTILISIVGTISIFLSLLFSSYKFPEPSEKYIADTYQMNYLPFYVSKGEVEKCETRDVIIQSINSSDEIINFEVENNTLNPGDYLNKGVNIGSYSPNFYGRVLEVNDNGDKDLIKAINYCNKLFIGFVDIKDLSVFKYDSLHDVYVGDCCCKAKVSYVDILLEESTSDAVKIEFTIDEESLKQNSNLYLINTTQCKIVYEKNVSIDTYRCFKSCFKSEELFSDNLVNCVVKKKETDKYSLVILRFGLIGDYFVEIIGDIEEGDIICA